MDFFQQLAGLGLVGDLKLVVKNTPDKMIVSVLLDNEKCGDNARKSIPPLILSGTAEELDGGFFQHVTEPMQQASGLQVNMEQYLKGKEEAERKSKMETDKADKIKKEAEAKKKVYDEAMKKVAELQKDKKYKEALGKMPKPADHPDQAQAITSKHTELMKLATGTSSLFDPPVESLAQVEEAVASDTLENDAEDSTDEDEDEHQDEDENEE